MIKYEIYKDAENISIFKNGNEFDEEDIENLWQEHKILYLSGSVVAIWLEDKEDKHTIIHLMDEDDGHIFWHKKNDKSFDSYWVSDYIELFTEVKNRLNR